MKFLAATVDAQQAWRRLHQVRFAGVRRLARKLLGFPAPVPQERHGELPFLELLWLPCHLLTFRRAAKERPVYALVGGFDAGCTVADLVGAEWEEAPEREVFLPAIDSATADEVAAAELTRIRSRRPGLRGGEISKPESSELIQYPYWVYYYQRARSLLGRSGLDVRVLDGVSGRPTGPKIKVALLRALSSPRRAPDGADAYATLGEA